MPTLLSFFWKSIINTFFMAPLGLIYICALKFIDYFSPRDIRYMCTELLIMYKPFRLAHSPHNNPVVRQTPRPCRHDPKRAYIVILTSLPPESFWTVETPSIHFPNAYACSCYLNKFLSQINNDASVKYRCASQMSIKKYFFSKIFLRAYSPRRSLCI